MKSNMLISSDIKLSNRIDRVVSMEPEKKIDRERKREREREREEKKI